MGEHRKIMTRQEILDQAANVVSLERDSRYGSPEDNFTCIAQMWSSYLSKQGLLTDVLDSVDVAAMMVLLKVARINPGVPYADNWVDIAGYAACGGELDTDGANQPTKMKRKYNSE